MNLRLQGIAYGQNASSCDLLTSFYFSSRSIYEKIFTYKSDGVPLMTQQINELSMTVFLQKRGSFGDRSQKGGSSSVIAQDPHNFNIFFQIFALICFFF